MRKLISRSFLFTAMTVAALSPSLSFGADGYFLTGYGPRQRALGGAGVANSRDAMAMSINPAGIVGLERMFQVELGVSLPERGYSTVGQPVVLAPGDVRSGRPIFPVPNGAYVQPIDASLLGASLPTATAASIPPMTLGTSSRRSKRAREALSLSLRRLAACSAAARPGSTSSSPLLAPPTPENLVPSLLDFRPRSLFRC